MRRIVKVSVPASQRNDAVAMENRAQFAASGVTVLNMISSPGSGKTSILEKMGARYGHALGVITGDIQTTLDAQRLAASGCQAIQIETGGSCHLTAAMIQKVLPQLKFSALKLLVIENVGNLVCPSTYDLGEELKVAVLSTAEGDEKPAKYPALFVRSAAVIINKIDLLPYVNFNMERAQRDCLLHNSLAQLFALSCTSGVGLDAWFAWIDALLSRPKDL